MIARSRCIVVCLLPALMAALLTSCTTIVRGGKPSARSDGIHYWLPMPVLRVTPNADGTLTVVSESVPDTRAEYVLSASSVLGTYKFEVKVDKGLLTEVTMNGDSSAVAKEVVDAGAEIEKARIAAEAAALKARETKVEGRETAIKAAIDAVRGKKQALQKLFDERAELVKQGYEAGSDEIKAIDIEIVNARSDLAAAEEDLDLLLKANAEDGENQDAGGAAAHHDAARAAGAWGPVVYQIEQSVDADGPTVRLVQADWNDGKARGIQLSFPIATTARPPTPEPDAPKFSPDGSLVIQPNEGRLQFTLKSSTALYAASAESIKRADNTTYAKPTISLQDGGTFLIVDVPKDLPDGTYRFLLHYTLKQDGPDATTFVEFVVQR